MNYAIYCDESGNSGGNFLDSQQPFYVLAGWMVERNIDYRAKNRVIDFKKLYYPDKTELKGSEILRSNRGQQNTNILFSEIGTYCSPFFIIAEKRYCLAAKMVEAYLDPIHNDNVPIEHTWMNSERKQIADLIYNISSKSIEEFGYAYQNITIENFTSSLGTLIFELNEKGFNDLANTFSGAYKYMDQIYEEEFSSIESLPKKSMRSLNLPVFTSFIQLIEKFTTNIGAKKVTMFHDNTKQFAEAYPEAFSWYARKKKEDIEFTLQNGQVILSSLKKLKSITFSDSKDSPLIQAADLLAGFINMYATRIMLDKKMSPELNKLGEMLIASLLLSEEFGGHGFSDFISSEYFIKKLAFNHGFTDKIYTKESLVTAPKLIGAIRN